MSARLGLFCGAALFAVSVVLAFADLWLLAVAVLSGPAYLAGRWDRHRDRLAAFVLLRAERDRAVAEAAGLCDELTYQYGVAHPDRVAAATVVRRDWPAMNRNTNTRDASPSHTTTPA
ncbi:hypothetical protein AB0B63_18640 [Micromonospora sp. NPDC049081]|uniref:hypothetical protein n=1 Tax=Micromonospora sp. NPDC049081 TaxID=3155150 RepID=UPI0034065DCF